MLGNEESKLAVNNIKRHDFVAAKESLRKYVEENQENPDLIKVPTDGGLFGLFSHKVTGDEINELTGQIQNYLIRLNQISHRMFGEFSQVYKAVEALDNEYINKIVDSLKATEEVNEKARRNREDIEDSIKNQDKIIGVLKNFKQKLEELEHLTDIDKAWKMLSEQQEALVLLIHFKEELAKIEHFDDIDTIWEHQSEIDHQIGEQNTYLVQLENAVEDAEKGLAELTAFRENLEKARHLGDIDSLWDDVSEMKTDIANEKTEMDVLASDFGTQRERLGTVEEDLKKQMDKLSLLSENLDENIKAFEASIAEVRGNLAEAENRAVLQKKLLEERKAEIDSRLTALEQNTAKMVEELRNTMTEENHALTGRVEKLTGKVKYALWISGGAIAVTVIHFTLSLMGVL